MDQNTVRRAEKEIEDAVALVFPAG